MGEKNYIDVKRSANSDSFARKSKLLGLSMEQQVELLNSNYKDKVEFVLNTDEWVDTPTHINIRWINPDIRILELPEVDNLNIGYVKISRNNEDTLENILKGRKLSTLKLPKSMKSIYWSTFAQFSGLTSLWIWDTTELKGEKHCSNIKMLVIQSTTGGKATVIKF